MRRVYVIGTRDTKRDEIDFAAAMVAAAGATPCVVDIATRPAPADADVAADVVASHHPRGAAHVLGSGDRGASLAAMGEALALFLQSRDDVGAVLGLGGSGNTAVVTAAMRALPDADAALFDAVRAEWRETANHALVEVDANINDPAFAQAAVAALREIA